MIKTLSSLSFVILSALAISAPAGAQAPAPMPTPPGILPGSITCEECPYPAPSAYFPITLYGQDLRMAYMDVAPTGPVNGHTAVLLHGNNFAGFYFGSFMDVLRKEGYRVIVPDQIGYGRSSKAIIPYNFHDWSRNTKLLLDNLKIDKAVIIGHSMGAMLAARFATQYPAVTERLVLYNPIGLVDPRWSRPWDSTDEMYKRALPATYTSVKAQLLRYVAHNPAAWNDEFERYARVRYSWTLSADWPRLAMVQTMISQVQYLDQVVDDWAHIKAPTLAIGGADDMLAGGPAVFRERMKYIADTVPGGNGRLVLLPGLGHVAHLEGPDRFFPPLVAFLKEGIAK